MTARLSGIPEPTMDISDGNECGFVGLCDLFRELFELGL